MKKVLEVIVCFIHPLAVVLAWINLLGRSDLTGLQKLAWGVFLLIPIVPFIYVLTGGDLW
jgi:NADH:ubiquinone oxidoreductase subunit 3 (subunit A)